MALPASDSFDRSNGALGANWTTQYGFTALTIASNQAAGSSSGAADCGSLWTADSFPNDQYSQATFIAEQTWWGTGIITRGSTTAQTCYYAVFQSGAVYFSKFVNGTFTDIGSASMSISSGDVMRLTSIGTTHTVYRNGTQVAQWTDSSIASGSAGIYCGGPNSIADTWSGGATATAIALESSVSGSATVTAALTTSIRLAATITGSATVSAAFVGSAAALQSGISAQATVSASLSTAIRLAATVTASSNVAGVLNSAGVRTTLEQLQTVSGKRIWLAHQSVGNYIMHAFQDDNRRGLTYIFNQNPSGGVSNVRAPSSIADIPAGTWADTWNGTNQYPWGKLDAFNTAVRTTFAGQLDYALFKFCWVDIFDSSEGNSPTTEAGVDSLWSSYQSTMDALETSYPGRVVYFTVPLTPRISSGGDGGNYLRERMSAYIRTKYGPTGRVFDIADYESRNESGTLLLNPDDGYRYLYASWDQGDGGHPSDAGVEMLAAKLLSFMSYLAQPGASNSLQASVSSASSVSASLTTAITLASSVSGSSSISATLAGTSAALQASISCTPSTSAALTTLIQLAASLSGAPSVSATLSGSATLLQAAISGAAAVSAGLSTSIRLNAALSGQATVSAPLSTAILLSASVFGSSQISAQLNIGGSVFLAAISGQSAVSGNLTTAILLAASLSGASQAQARFDPLILRRGSVITLPTDYRRIALAAEQRLYRLESLQ